MKKKKAAKKVKISKKEKERKKEKEAMWDNVVEAVVND